MRAPIGGMLCLAVKSAVDLQRMQKQEGRQAGAKICLSLNNDSLPRGGSSGGLFIITGSFRVNVCYDKLFI